MATNTIDSNGITTQTLQDIVDEILNGTADYPGMYQIYGADINVAPNSPDGQMVHIVAQAKLDMLEFIRQVFSSLDPDQALGVVLDQRCAINGVTRKAGTYTQTPITVTVDRALTLAGLDTAPNSPFTISDNSGNKYALVSSHSFSGAGSASISFQATTLGAVTPTLNSITSIVTVTLGVISVNNPSAASIVGADEETDYAMRIRRTNSTALGSKGFLAGLRGALLNTAGVTSAEIQENIPAHTIWCVVAGGSDVAVANAIYVKRSFGVGMIGSLIVPITQADGSIFLIQFDRPMPQNLWIKFNLTAVTGFVDPTYVRAQILTQLSYAIGASAVSSAITALVQRISPNALVSFCQVSGDGVTYVDLLAPTAFNYEFGTASTRILINGLPGT